MYRMTRTSCLLYLYTHSYYRLSIEYTVIVYACNAIVSAQNKFPTIFLLYKHIAGKVCSENRYHWVQFQFLVLLHGNQF